MAKVSIEKVYKDLERLSKVQSKIHRKMREDFEFALGKQWKDDDKKTLERAGVLALTINHIKPQIKILTGIERQSRSDFVAYPEGGEDALTGDIVTRLLKNVVKQSRADKKLSEQFKEGITGGLCFIEPYLDYTHDLINGEFKLRKVSADRCFFDMKAEEYDLSDSSVFIKMTYNLSEDQLGEIFPEDEKKIKDVKVRRVDFKDFSNIHESIQTRDYEFKKDNEVGDNALGEGYDLVEYFYKSPKDVFYLADKATGNILEFASKQEAEDAIAQSGFQSPVIIKKKVPEIRLKQVVGDVEFSDEVAWSYPRWKYYPIFPFFAERMTVDINDDEVLVQGIVRSLTDLQIELNKSRTLELRHLNSTANSGWMFPKKMLDPKTLDSFKRFGSTPGFVGEYDIEKSGGVVSAETFRIRPADLPQGHMALSAERINEIKQTSGINPDLLANDSQSQSGRAILLKQRQGLVMIQEALDNYADTKKLLGRFILSQLGEIYTVESALRVLGDQFVRDNFSRPQINDDGSVKVDDRGQVVQDVDVKEVSLIINKILNDSTIGRFDVSIGEGAYSETIKFTNFTTIMDMIEKGIPIPPDIIVQESLLSESQKKKILAAIDASRQAAK